MIDRLRTKVSMCFSSPGGVFSTKTRRNKTNKTFEATIFFVCPGRKESRLYFLLLLQVSAEDILFMSFFLAWTRHGGVLEATDHRRHESLRKKIVRRASGQLVVHEDDDDDSGVWEQQRWRLPVTLATADWKKRERERERERGAVAGVEGGHLEREREEGKNQIHLKHRR